MHPDLREGVLKSDLPKAYVSEVGYGHRLLLSVNISVPVIPHSPPAHLESIGQLLLRVVARDISGADFDRMFPGVSLFARFRWDPDLAPPLEAIQHMQVCVDVFFVWIDFVYGERECERREKSMRTEREYAPVSTENDNFEFIFVDGRDPDFDCRQPLPPPPGEFFVEREKWIRVANIRNRCRCSHSIVCVCV